MKNLTVLFLVFCSAFLAFAQDDSDRANDDRRKQFFKEVRDYKHNFLAKELSLTKEQQKEFFAVYDEMEDAVATLNEETRDLEKKIAENIDQASDLELEKATEAIFDLKVKEGEMEKAYAEKYRQILSKRQLFLLKSAERNFNRDLLQHQARLRRKARN